MKKGLFFTSILFFANIVFATTQPDVQNVWTNGGTLRFGSDVTSDIDFTPTNVASPISLYFNGYTLDLNNKAGLSYNNSGSGTSINFYDLKLINSLLKINTITSSSANAGALYNAGAAMTFSGDTSFTGNSTAADIENLSYNSAARGISGAINMHSGTMTFSGDTSFAGNSAEVSIEHDLYQGTVGTFGAAGAIYMDGGTMIFDGNTYFTDNSASISSKDNSGQGGVSAQVGGAIALRNGTMIFGGDAHFSGNGGFSSRYGYAGAPSPIIRNSAAVNVGSGGTMTFLGDAYFS